jgi:hypothetical protein
VKAVVSSRQGKGEAACTVLYSYIAYVNSKLRQCFRRSPPALLGQTGYRCRLYLYTHGTISVSSTPRDLHLLFRAVIAFKISFLTSILQLRCDFVTRFMFCVYEETVNRILRMLTAAASPLTPSFPQGFGLSKRSVFSGMLSLLLPRC